MRRGTWISAAVLAGVLLVQTYLVVASFNPSPHSGGDNAGYVTLAYSLLEFGQYADLYDPARPAHTKYPPGFPLLLAAAIALGARTWLALKSLSAVLMVASVALAFVWIHQRRGLRFAAAGALVLACSESFLYSSRWILSDPLFLALTLGALVAFDRVASTAPEPSEADAVPTSDHGSTGWFAVGVGLMIAAYFTRSAGLPLVVAVIAWLALRREWSRLAVAAVAVAIPAVLWTVRTAAVGAPSYLSEFWMMNPYQPELGRAGAVDLMARVGENTVLYVGRAIPGGLTGLSGAFPSALGTVLVLVAIVGWVRYLSERPSVAELFLPLYAGLILLWPVVWSGDRFALPLFPLILFYAGSALVDGVGRLAPRLVTAGGLALVVFLVAPALGVWRTTVREARACRETIEERGVFGCYGERMREFVTVATWAGGHLPPGARVFSRKPRIFYVMSGLQGRAYPLVADLDVLASSAEEADVRYVVLDYLDSLSRFYLVPPIREHPGAFCSVAGFGGATNDGIATELLGLLPRSSWALRASEDREDGTLSVTMLPCGPEWWVREGRDGPDQASGAIPLLLGLDS